MSQSPSAAAGNENPNKKQESKNNILGIDFNSNPLSKLSNTSFSMTMPSFSNNDHIKAENSTPASRTTISTTQTTNNNNNNNEKDKTTKSTTNRFQKEGKELLDDLNQKGRDGFNFITNLPSNLPSFLTKSLDDRNDQSTNATSNTPMPSNTSNALNCNEKTSKPSSPSLSSSTLINETKTTPDLPNNSNLNDTESNLSQSTSPSPSVPSPQNTDTNNEKRKEIKNETSKQSFTLPPSSSVSFNNTTTAERLQKEGRELLIDLNQKGRDSIKHLTKQIPVGLTTGFRSATPTTRSSVHSSVLEAIDETNELHLSSSTEIISDYNTTSMYPAGADAPAVDATATTMNRQISSSTIPATNSNNNNNNTAVSMKVIPSSSSPSTTSSETSTAENSQNISNWSKFKRKLNNILETVTAKTKNKPASVHLEYLNKFKNHNYMTSIKYENVNKKLGIICLIIGLIWIFRPFYFIWVYFSGQKVIWVKYLWMKVLVEVLFVSAVAHRMLGYCGSALIRYLLKGHWKDNGKYNIHIGWASYRGWLDQNQLVLHHILWRNPPNFDNTPYLAYIHEASLSFSLADLIQYIRDGKCIRADNFVIDTVELYSESTNKTRDIMSASISSNNLNNTSSSSSYSGNSNINNSNTTTATASATTDTATANKFTNTNNTNNNNNNNNNNTATAAAINVANATATAGFAAAGATIAWVTTTAATATSTGSSVGSSNSSSNVRQSPLTTNTTVNITTAATDTDTETSNNNSPNISTSSCGSIGNNSTPTMQQSKLPPASAVPVAAVAAVASTSTKAAVPLVSVPPVQPVPVSIAADTLNLIAALDFAEPSSSEPYNTTNTNTTNNNNTGNNNNNNSNSSTSNTAFSVELSRGLYELACRMRSIVQAKYSPMSGGSGGSDTSRTSGGRTSYYNSNTGNTGNNNNGGSGGGKSYGNGGSSVNVSVEPSTCADEYEDTIYEYDMNNTSDPVMCSTACSSGTGAVAPDSSTTTKIPAPTNTYLDTLHINLNRLIIYDIKLHIADALTNQYHIPSKKTDVVIKAVLMKRNRLTSTVYVNKQSSGSNSESEGSTLKVAVQRPLQWYKFIDAVLNSIIDTGLSENRTSFTSLLTLISTKTATEKAESAATAAATVASSAVKTIENVTHGRLKSLREAISASATAATAVTQTNFPDFKSLLKNQTVIE